ncbi:MAG: 2-C-methyl-D-erythritol 4-phosphate cytidylyltransferase [Chloroflexi bacterium]|nr:2-C-methyl-D-erythritol 4-phosphate cytidylyltransferase [Chloroflexota bacterium]
MSQPHHLVAVLLAAGAGRRFGGDKMLTPLAGRPVLWHSLLALQRARPVEAVVVVASAENAAAIGALVAEAGWRKVSAVCQGGARRQDSVRAALAAAPPSAYVLVHDGARPLVTPTLVARGLRAAERWGAATAAVPASDTIKMVDAQRRVRQTLDRRALWLVQTPQVFRRALLEEAHARAEGEATDDAALVERLGHPVGVFVGSRENVKITDPADLAMAEALLRQRAVERSGAELRVGHGYDVHRLAPGRRLILGGVELAHPAGLGLFGHSDADVLTHAIMDALLGAAGLGDIGQRFSPNDAAYRGADSVALLRQVRGLLARAGWRVVNVDATVVAEAPRLAPHVAAMRGRLSAALGVPAERVSVKATTAEGLGPIGAGQGIEARAVVLLARAGLA